MIRRASILLGAAARTIAAALAAGGTPTYAQKAQAADQALTAHFGKRSLKRASDAASDPYFGIRSKGRTGARKCADAHAAAFAISKIGVRNARGRAKSSVHLRPEAAA